MLDDYDRRRLREIERQLGAHDPGLARHFETAAARSGRTHLPTLRKAGTRPFSRLIGLLLVLLVVSLLIAPLAGSVLLFIAVVCLLAARWLVPRAER